VLSPLNLNQGYTVWTQKKPQPTHPQPTHPHKTPPQRETHHPPQRGAKERERTHAGGQGARSHGAEAERSEAGTKAKGLLRERRSGAEAGEGPQRGTGTLQ